MVISTTSLGFCGCPGTVVVGGVPPAAAGVLDEAAPEEEAAPAMQATASSSESPNMERFMGRMYGAKGSDARYWARTGWRVADLTAPFRRLLLCYP
ncbi:hypothetical protein MASR1M101_30900 [Gemmatimonas sp.]